MKEPSLVSRIYNGLDKRQGFQVILTKPIAFAPPVPPKRSWWRRILGPYAD